MRRFIYSLTILFFTHLTASAKLVIIDIKKTLAEATVIRSVVVIGYEDSMVLYRLESEKDTLRILCKTKSFSESFRLLLIEKKVMKATDLAGMWPTAGEKVLMVINARNRVALFAYRKGFDFRFWDPNSMPFANSIFSVQKEQFYKPLVDCDYPFSGNANNWMCTDGCLVSVFGIVERGVVFTIPSLRFPS